MLTEQGSSEGLKRSDVVAWYLEQVQDQIETEEELLERKTLVEKVIDRLIYHVSYCSFLLSMKD
jgi:DNA replication licensing factor MCM6